MGQCSVNLPSRHREKPKEGEPELSWVQLPEGFEISYYAKEVENARSMEWGDDQTLYVGTRNEDLVYALRDEDGDGFAEKKYVLVSGLTMPNGVAYRDGDLYIVEVDRVSVLRDITGKWDQPPKMELVFDGYPSERSHGWKYVAFGPDGQLYVPVGAPCNICESDDRIFNTITRLDIDRKEMEIVHEGIRNTVGFGWHPETGELWFTDNGRDWLGDDLPADELNHAPTDGLHFGYPYCHQGDLGRSGIWGEAGLR